MEIYIDNDYKTHVSPGEGLTSVQTNVFDGKCNRYIAGYRFVPDGEKWTREDGVVFHGEMVAPWKPLDELDAAQREYERKQLADYEHALSEIEAALGVSG